MAKTKKVKLEPVNSNSVNMMGILYEYDQDEGTYWVQVKTKGAYITVSKCCESEEAEQVIQDLCSWKRGE